MKKDWEIKKWKDVLEIRSGRNQNDVENPNGKYPILGSAGKIMGFADDYICDEGTTIVGRKGTIDNPIFIETKFWNVDTAFGLHALDFLDKRFLFYFCRSYDFTKQDKGSGRPSLVKTDLLQIEIPLPPLPEQQHIVSILDESFAAIAKAKANAEQNLKNAKDLFDSTLQKLFEKKSEGWEIKALGDVIQIRNGKNQKEVLDESGEYKIMGSAGNVMGYANNYICEAGTTIIGRKGNISKPIYIDEKFWNVDTAFGFFPENENVMDKKFVYYLCLGIDFKSMNRGTTIPSLVKSELQTIQINFPKSLIDQLTIVEKLDTLSTETKRLEAIYQQKLLNLEELKKSLLQKAFSGELKTKEAV